MPPAAPLDPRDWPQVQALFQQALDLPEDRRAAFVRAAATEPGVRDAALALLAADLDPASILDGSAEGYLGGALQADPASTDPLLGADVGPYRVLEPLGQGGMGRVYRARHGELGHVVALKVIRRGMASEAMVRRFAQERQIVASLAHPNIARLFDGGVTGDGIPWFSMELVAGEPIDAYCARRNLSLRDRLRRFATVCDAVQYAHARLVVHRDLKPGNILVGEDGSPKLLDFGIAKLLDEEMQDATALTQTGVRPMSPAHAAPEQIRDEPISTAADVYALGVVLYELVAGRGPYGSDLAGRALEEAILTVTPPRPSTVAGRRSDRFASDLDNITLMALRKEPERRYPSAGAFAEDVRRLLSGHPVTATRDSARYRIAKFVARNRAAVTATAAGLLLTGASVGWYTGQLRDERAQAQLEADKAEQVSRFLQEIFTAADPLGLTPDAPKGLDITAGQLLAGAVDRLDDDLDAQPAVRASLLSVLGETYRSLGEYQRAVDLLERADTALARIDHPDPMLQAQVDNALGSALWELGEFDRAEAAQRKAYEFVAANVGPDDHRLGVTANDYGLVLWQLGKRDEAERLLAQSLAAFRAASDSATPALATAIANHALLLRELGRIDESEASYREAIAMERATLGADHPSVASSIGKLSQLLLEDKGDLAGAEALTLEALHIREKAFGERHPYVAVSLNELAAVYRAERKYDLAEEYYRKALALRREVYEPDHPFIAYSLAGLGELLIDTGRAAEAEPLFREAVAIRRKALPAGHWLLGDTESRLGRCLVLLGRRSEGERLLREGGATVLASLGPDDRRTREAEARLDSLTVPTDAPPVAGQ